MKIPKSARAALWSYDVDDLDRDDDRTLIISNILNLGTKEAVSWLFKIYKKSEIKSVLQASKPGLWNKRSINLWSLVFKTPIHLTTRF